MKKWKVGIVGCGSIFSVHTYSLKFVNAEIAAVCDIDSGLAAKKAEELGCACYTDYKEMIMQSGIDVVHVCAPHYLHAPITIFAAEHKKHVLTEKPMATSLEDAKEMIRCAAENGITLGVIFQNRFNPGSRLIKDTLMSGELGGVITAELDVRWGRFGDYYTKSGWRGRWATEGGGVIINQSIHTFDLANWFINSEIEKTDAFIATRFHDYIEVEDIADGAVSYKNGAKLFFNVYSYNSYNAPVRIHLRCEKGTAELIGERAHIIMDNGKEYIADRDPADTFTKDGQVYWGIGHMKQIAEYYNALEEKRPPWIDGEAALPSHELIFEIYKKGKMQ